MADKLLSAIQNQKWENVDQFLVENKNELIISITRQNKVLVSEIEFGEIDGIEFKPAFILSKLAQDIIISSLSDNKNFPNLVFWQRFIRPCFNQFTQVTFFTVLHNNEQLVFFNKLAELLFQNAVLFRQALCGSHMFGDDCLD